MNRRELVLGASTLPLIVSLSSRTVAQAATPEVSSLPPIPHGGDNADGSWSFTDDVGNTILLPSRPTRVAAYISLAGALHDFGFDVVGYWSVGFDPLELAPELPHDRMVQFGSGQELDIEALIQQGIELFVGPSYDISQAKSMWPFDDDILAQVAGAAAVIQIAHGDGAGTDRVIEAVGNLAIALGSDPNAEVLVEARTALEAQTVALEDVIASKPGLTALFLGPVEDGYYIGGGTSDITYFENLGLRHIKSSDSGLRSWENFPSEEADLILVDDRAHIWASGQLEADVPGWSVHPAVAAGQVYLWEVDYLPSYQSFLRIVQALTENLSEAEVPI